MKLKLVPKVEPETFNINVPVRLSDNGSVLMKFADCFVSVLDDCGNQLGGIGSTIGGTIQCTIQKDGKYFDYRIRPQDVWNMICKHHGELNNDDMSDYIHDNEVELT